jgi:uncharacterized protein YeaO (DUF488 family)
MSRTVRRINIKRIYEPASSGDGTRVLVDRLWPRGLSKSAAAIDHWCKETAPSSALRKWFGHDPERWDDFRKRYWRELASRRDAVKEIRDLAQAGTITLLYSAHDEVHNNAVALRQFLRAKQTPRRK